MYTFHLNYISTVHNKVYDEHKISHKKYICVNKNYQSTHILIGSTMKTALPNIIR